MNANAPPAPTASPSSARTVRDGVEIAYVREGEGGYPAAAAARLAGDEAHLVAQHRAARRGRLRGDRAGPARLRRLGPRARRLLRPGHARARHARPRPRRARPRALRGGGRRRRRRRGPGPRPALRRVRRAPVPVQHGAADPAGASTRRPGSRREVPREVRMAADYFMPPGARRGRARRRARHARASAAATSRSSTARASGRRRAPSRARTSTS